MMINNMMMINRYYYRYHLLLLHGIHSYYWNLINSVTLNVAAPAATVIMITNMIIRLIMICCSCGCSYPTSFLKTIICSGSASRIEA